MEKGREGTFQVVLLTAARHGRDGTLISEIPVSSSSNDVVVRPVRPLNPVLPEYSSASSLTRLSNGNSGNSSHLSQLDCTLIGMTAAKGKSVCGCRFSSYHLGLLQWTVSFHFILSAQHNRSREAIFVCNHMDTFNLNKTVWSFLIITRIGGQ